MEKTSKPRILVIDDDSEVRQVLSLMLESGGYDETMVSYEDWDLLLTLHERGRRGDVLPAEFFYYRRRYDSMVYAVANPRRAELVQYMMLKHRALLQPHAALMAIVLSRLWKEAEKAAEKLTSDETPIRWKEIRRLFRKYLRWKTRRLGARLRGATRPGKGV